jgi:hypothetical protein
VWVLAVRDGRLLRKRRRRSPYESWRTATLRGQIRLATPSHQFWDVLFFALPPVLLLAAARCSWV